MVLKVLKDWLHLGLHLGGLGFYLGGIISDKNNVKLNTLWIFVVRFLTKVKNYLQTQFMHLKCWTQALKCRHFHRNIVNTKMLRFCSNLFLVLPGLTVFVVFIVSLRER